MTEYNDGKWHGWNGGECPVDTESTVLIQTVYGVDGSANDDPLFAGDCEWNWTGGRNDIIAFRVTKPAPPKPREWWVSGGNCLWDTYAEAYNACDRGEKPIHVREVLPE